VSILNEPRKPDCDVCDWATSSWWAHGLNLCQADFELIRKVVKTEQDRIIKLLEDEIQRLVDMAGQREGGPAWRSAGIENCEHLIALIKGKNN